MTGAVEKVAAAINALKEALIAEADHELARVNAALRDAGIDYPQGVRGVEDLGGLFRGQVERAEAAERERDDYGRALQEFRDAHLAHLAACADKDELRQIIAVGYGESVALRKRAEAAEARNAAATVSLNEIICEHAGCEPDCTAWDEIEQVIEALGGETATTQTPAQPAVAAVGATEPRDGGSVGNVADSEVPDGHVDDSKCGCLHYQGQYVVICGKHYGERR